MACRKERGHRSRERRQPLAELLAFHLVRRRELRISLESQCLAGRLDDLALSTQANPLLARQELQGGGWRGSARGGH